MHTVWMKALTAAAKGEHLSPAIDYEYYYHQLGLDPSIVHEPSVVNRAFRTLVAEAPVGRDGKAERVSSGPNSYKDFFLSYSNFVSGLCSSRSFRKHSTTSWPT